MNIAITPNARTLHLYSVPGRALCGYAVNTPEHAIPADRWRDPFCIYCAMGRDAIKGKKL